MNSLARTILIIATPLLFGAASVPKPTPLDNPTTPTPYRVVHRDANSAVWRRLAYEQQANGTVVTNVHSYTQLQTGLNFQDPTTGQWLPSKEEIEACPGGAIAKYGAHKVRFANNLNGAGAIDLQTPDGREMRSHVLGLSYYDSARGKSVLIAQVKDCRGHIVAHNQVIYADAFEGVKADVRYTYGLGSFEQDVILLEQPPKPERFGFSAATTALQVLTEFDSAPPPSTQVAAASSTSVLKDHILNFGTMTMGPGKTFLIGQNRTEGVPVYKQWLGLNGRDVLAESVPQLSIRDQLQQLAASRTGSQPNLTINSPLYVVSSERQLPAPKSVQAPRGQMEFAQWTPRTGLVLDYVVTPTGYTNGDYTFQSDTTYYVTGTFGVNGTVTIEGGTVIKYAENGNYQNGGILPLGMFKCLTSEYRPAIITSAYDNSVGESVAAGTPSRYNCSSLDFDVSTTFTGPVQYLHIRYSAVGLTYGDVPLPPLRHCQFVNVGTGVQDYDSGILTVENCLFSGVSSYVFDTAGIGGCSFTASQSTVDSAAALTAPRTPLNLVNSILSRVTSLGTTPTGDQNLFYLSPLFGSNQHQISSTPFQTALAGNYYVTSTSYKLGPVANISASLLADFQNMTTFPPTLQPAGLTISSPTAWNQTAARETSTGPLMLGYHYPALDYLVKQVNVQGTTLTLGQSVAVGVYGGVGLQTYTASTLISQGTPLAHNQLCFYPSVQEQPSALGGTQLMEWWGGDPPSIVKAQFTDFDGMSARLGLFDGYDFQIQLQNCWLGPGYMTPNSPPGCCYTDGITNNLFERATLDIGTFDYECPVFLYNNTVINSYVQIDNDYAVNSWRTIKDNLFDNSVLSMAYPNYVNYGYNAYSGGSTALLPYHQGDFSVDTLVYATGPLGFRYIDYSTSPTLLDAGDQSSAAAGLCHYTIVADQTLDGGTVDIGYHYYVPSQPFPNSQWVLTSVNTPTTIILSEGGCTDLSQNDTFTITDTPQPGGGSVAPTVGYGKVVYTPPNATFAGEDDFDFRVSNVGGSSYSTAQVRVFVVPPPQLSLTCLSDRIVLVWTIDSTLQNLEFPNPPFLQPYTDIYRYDNTGWHLIHTSDFDERAYVDTAVQPNLHYSYRVKIRYVDGWGNVSGTRYSNIPNSTTCPTKPAPIGLVTGNDANEDVKTINFSNGSLVNDFGPPGEFNYWTGRGLAIHNGEIFYSGVDSTFDFSDGIHVCNYGNSGSGASTDNRVLTNPRPSGFGIQDLAFHNNQLYVLTGYAENPLKVYQLDPVSGNVIGNPNGISITPAILDPVNGSPGTSDGFVVLPSGNFLINDFDGGEGCSVYREYNGTTGVLVTGGLVIDLKTYGYNSGTGVTLAPDGQSLYFMAHVERSFEFPHNAIIRTDLTGQLIGLQPLDDQTYGDSELEDIDVVFP